MILLKRLIRNHKLGNVFTPSKHAKLTYVERPDLESDLKKFLELPGMQIVLYGHSGCGKSTLVTNKLHELKIKYITTRCDSSTTFSDIIKHAFDKLDVFYNNEKTLRKTNTHKTDHFAKYREIGLSFTQESTNEQGCTSVRALPLQLTPQRLAELMGAANCIWIIEDFHKVSNPEKKKIADIMKIFIDTTNDFTDSIVKVICIGAVGTARELIELDTNLSTRIAEIYVPLLKESELGTIVETGFDLMNVKHNGGIKEKIIYYSNNLASICHQICYDICYNKGFTKSSIVSKKIGENDFKDAVVSYVRKNSDTFTRIYDKVCVNPNHKNVLIALVKCDKEFCSGNDIYKEFQKISNLQRSKVTESIESLCTNEFEEVFRFDQNSKRFTFSSPFFQAFVKMKLALEKLENEERSARKVKKFDLDDEGLSSIESFINDDFLIKYYKELESSYSRRINEYQKILDSNTKIEIKKK